MTRRHAETGARRAAAVTLLLIGACMPQFAGEPDANRDAGRGAAADADPDKDATPAPEPAPAPAPAPPPDPAPPQETVVVTAPADEVAADTAAFATVLHVGDLDNPLLSLPEVLRRAVGVQVRSLGGEFATVSIRGSTAEQVVVYLDGVPLNHALGGGVNLADVPLVGLDTIEIYRGSTPASLSEASIGGAILLHTQPPREGSQVGGHLGIGSYGYGEAGASWSFGRGRGDGVLAFDGATSNGDFTYLDDNATPYEPADDVESVRVNNDFIRGHVVAKGGWRAGAARLDFGADLFSRDSGVPGVDAWQSTGSRLRTGRMLLHTGVEVPGLASGRLLLRGLLSHLAQDQEFDGTQGNLALMNRSTDNRLTSTGGEGSGTFALSRRQGLSFLCALRLEDADLHDRLNDSSDDSSERGRAERRVATLTAEDTIDIADGRVVLLPSLRHERWTSRFEPGPAPGLVPSRTETADQSTTGRLGTRVRLRPGLDLRLNAGSFLRLPDLTELYGDQGTIVGNQALVPESGVNVDLGLSVRAARPGSTLRDLTAEISLFATDAEDLILYVPNSPTTVKAENIGEARIRGIEMSFGFEAGPRLGGTLNAVHQDAVDAGDQYEGKQLPGRPRDEVSASASLLLWGGRAAWEFTYVGPNYIDAINSESGRLPARYLHALSYRRPMTRHLEASFEVQNLFDDRAVDVARFPLPGRTFGARLQWTY